jgi:tetratricopeptide (TPR) repeat protein
MPWLNPFVTPSGQALNAGRKVVWFPAYVLWTMWGFLVSWSETRRYRLLWQGFPAAALACLFFVLLLWQGRPASQETVGSYLEKARQATHLEEYEKAAFYFRKLRQLAPADTRIRYEHALFCAEQGDYQQAASLMLSLTEDDNRSGAAKVHLWLARSALEGKLDISHTLAFAKHHLNQVLEDDPDNRYAHFFFSDLFLRLNDLDNAIRHLEPIASHSPELQMQLASLYGLRGDRKRSHSLACESANLLEQQIRSDQTTDVDVWIRLAGSYLLMEDYQKAANVLKQALIKFEDDRARKFLAQAYVRWSDHVAKENPEDVAEKMRLLQEALSVAPDEPAALQRIIALAHSEGEAADQAKQRLKQALAEGHATAVIHFALGTMEASDGNLDVALYHLDLANAINPRTAVTLNNLAFVLSHVDPPRLERALEAITQAVRLQPGIAQFRETRGQILARLGRFREAITDLEFALPATRIMPTRINIHLSLARCYEQLGDAALVRIHQRKAEELRVANDAAKPPQKAVSRFLAVPDGELDRSPANELPEDDDSPDWKQPDSFAPPISASIDESRN